MGRNYWQIAAGSEGRDYSKIFQKFGLAFVGGESQMATMDQVKPGDIVVLKFGLSTILAAGEVVEREGISKGNGDKEWLLDYDGWVLPAYCTVDWRLPDKPLITSGLTRSTIQKLPQPKHRKIADKLITKPTIKREHEPQNTQEISDIKILEFLISEGLRPGAADDLTNTIRRIRLLAEYYYNKCPWDEIGEHEIRTFLVIPLLLALGWAEQQLKIEYKAGNGKADIVGFTKPYHLEKYRECILILETKDFGSGLDYAPIQAKRYARAFPSCRVLVVSNGFCYKSYVRKKKDEFSDIPSAYFNIMKPRDRYPLDPDNVDGALGVLRWLLPQSFR